MSEATINAILTHLPASEIASQIRWWKREMPEEELLVVYGGEVSDIDEIDSVEVLRADGQSHRTADHQRERQSYAGVLRSIEAWLAGKSYRFVNLLEFDVQPLVPDWSDRLEASLELEGAALLGHRLQRIDGTGHVHCLNHVHDPAFGAYWESVSVRAEPGVILTMFGFHSFWRRDAFEAVAALPEPFPIYLELYMPTLAHHLGFRVRPMPNPSESMRPSGEVGSAEIDAARAAGALAVHPVKGGWS